MLIALTFHEYAHAKAADMLGDPTPRRSGRLSLNPVDHIDPLGLLMLVFVRFGWARPVPVNPFNFKGDRNRGILLVSIAGPLSNLLLGFLSVIFFYLFRLRVFGFSPVTVYMGELFQMLTIYNIYLMLFNLIPLPPLDGSKVLTSLLPVKHRIKYGEIEQYAPFILVLLLITGVLPRFLSPVAFTVIGALETMALPFIRLFI